MPDHIKLSVPIPLTSKRSEGAPIRPDLNFNRGHQASNIAGILAGLEAEGFKLFPVAGPADDGAVGDVEEAMGVYVLKFVTQGAPRKGPFRGLKMTSLGENDDNEFFVLSDDESRRLLTELLTTYGSYAIEAAAAEEALLPGEVPKTPPAWAAMLDKIKGVELYGAHDRRDPSLDGVEFNPTAIFDVVLWPTSILNDSSAAREAAARLATIGSALESNADTGIEARILNTDSRPDTLSMRVDGNREALELMLSHPFVQRVRGRLEVSVTPGDLIQAGNRTDPLPAEGAAIGIVDDLVITANPWLRNVVQAHASFPVGFPFGAATDHGTAVASIAAYGNFTDAVRGDSSQQPFPIYAARVAQASSTGPAVVDDVVQQFERALTWLSDNDVRIAVISLGYQNADTDPLPTELAVTVDRLARELDMVIVVSAGNVLKLDAGFHWMDHYPKYLAESSSKIASPGTAALAITVGSVATSAESADPTLRGIAAPGHPSPFSRVGPTRGNRFSKSQKPEFVAPGGNWGWRPNAVAPVPSDSNLAVVSLSTTNTPLFAAHSGTSFSAPYVAHEVARVATRYPEASANLLRALTALSSPRLPSEAHPGLAEAISSAYGVPDTTQVLESGGNRAVLVFEGEIPTGSRAIHELPIPDEFVRVAEGADRELRVVLAFDPPVKRSRRDYVAGRMKFEFVRNVALEEVKLIWEAQPTLEQVRKDPKLLRRDKPTGRQKPAMIPGILKASSNTLIRRDFREQSWDIEDESYFLVVSHDTSPWTAPQLREYTTQKYALAIELIDVGRTDIDLHGLTLLRQRELATIRSRARAR